MSWNMEQWCVHGPAVHSGNWSLAVQFKHGHGVKHGLGHSQGVRQGLRHEYVTPTWFSWQSDGIIPTIFKA